MTEDQVAGVNGFNNPQHAKLLCESGELASRKHRYKCLADAGVFEFRLTDELYRRVKGVKQDNGVEGTVELRPEEFTEVKDSLVAAAGDLNKTIVKKKEPSKPKVDPLKKELAQTNTKLQVSLRGLKRKMDCMFVETEGLQDQTVKLKEKGYPASMEEHWKTKIQEFQSVIEAAKSVYCEYVTKPDERSADKVNIVKEALDAVDTESVRLTRAKKEFDKNTGTDIKKLTS